MKTAFYASLGATGFIAAVFLGHLAVAYPVIREGCLALILLAIAALAIFAILGMITARMKLGASVRRSDLIYGSSPAIVGAIALVAALALGAYIGG